MFRKLAFLVLLVVVFCFMFGFSIAVQAEDPDSELPSCCQEGLNYGEWVRHYVSWPKPGWVYWCDCNSFLNEACPKACID